MCTEGGYQGPKHSWLALIIFDLLGQHLQQQRDSCDVVPWCSAGWRTVKGTCGEYSEGTESLSTLKDKVLGGIHPILLLTREVFFVLWATEARNNILGTLWSQPVHCYLIYVGWK